ncbi:MAG: hypothetical protein JWN45_2095 [Acidobacteriaceae bacterium]|nr:hypothetical protein [Acidobacteriaceae bacterium]
MKSFKCPAIPNRQRGWVEGTRKASGGDVQRKMESAVRVFAVDDVLAFGCFLIARLCLSANRITAQRNLVSFEDLAVIKQCERARALHDSNAVGLRCCALVHCLARRA